MEAPRELGGGTRNNVVEAKEIWKRGRNHYVRSVKQQKAAVVSGASLCVVLTCAVLMKAKEIYVVLSLESVL